MSLGCPNICRRSSRTCSCPARLLPCPTHWAQYGQWIMSRGQLRRVPWVRLDATQALSGGSTARLAQPEDPIPHTAKRSPLPPPTAPADCGVSTSRARWRRWTTRRASCGSWSRPFSYWRRPGRTARQAAYDHPAGLPAFLSVDGRPVELSGSALDLIQADLLGGIPERSPAASGAS